MPNTNLEEGITIKVPPKLAEKMPSSQAEQQEIVRLGLVQWRVRKALEEYRQGGCSLAYAAKQAGIPLREMISFAYAYGLEPRFDEKLLQGELTLEQAAQL